MSSIERSKALIKIVAFWTLSHPDRLCWLAHTLFLLSLRCILIWKQSTWQYLYPLRQSSRFQLASFSFSFFLFFPFSGGLELSFLSCLFAKKFLLLYFSSILRLLQKYKDSDTQKYRPYHMGYGHLKKMMLLCSWWEIIGKVTKKINLSALIYMQIHTLAYTYNKKKKTLIDR